MLNSNFSRHSELFFETWSEASLATQVKQIFVSQSLGVSRFTQPKSVVANSVELYPHEEYC
jgi:hypothetical protein